MYNQLQAKRIIYIEPNQHDGRFFVKVLASDGKTYQVKFNAPGQKSNINEFISNYIGKIIKAPVLNGAFITFSQDMTDRLVEHLKLHFPTTKLPDMSCIKNNQLFGIEWQNSIIPLQTNTELEILLDKTNNSNQFYSLYSYDQYLKNFDRHIGNHIIIKDENKKPSYYSLIDGDRIFGSLGWERLEIFKDDFSCLKAIGATWHKYLYNLIDDKKYNHVLKYATNIDELKEEQIALMINILKHIYTIDKSDYDKIMNYLMSRKTGFYSVCINNATCFPNIKQRRGL